MLTVQDRRLYLFESPADHWVDNNSLRDDVQCPMSTSLNSFPNFRLIIVETMPQVGCTLYSISLIHKWAMNESIAYRNNNWPSSSFDVNWFVRVNKSGHWCPNYSVQCTIAILRKSWVLDGYPWFARRVFRLKQLHKSRNDCFYGDSFLFERSFLWKRIAASMHRYTVIRITFRPKEMSMNYGISEYRLNNPICP